MSKKKKVVVRDEGPSVKRTRQASNPYSYDAQAPCWRFGKRKKGNHKWSISQENWSVWENEILPKLVDFESMTWNEIKNGPNSHNVSVGRIIEEAQDDLTANKLIYDEVFSLRLTGKKRIWGFLENGVLNIIWYDAEHEICPSLKKHT